LHTKAGFQGYVALQILEN